MGKIVIFKGWEMFFLILMICGAAMMLAANPGC